MRRARVLTRCCVPVLYRRPAFPRLYASLRSWILAAVDLRRVLVVNNGYDRISPAFLVASIFGEVTVNRRWRIG